MEITMTDRLCVLKIALEPYKSCVLYDSYCFSYFFNKFHLYKNLLQRLNTIDTSVNFLSGLKTISIYWYQNFFFYFCSYSFKHCLLLSFNVFPLFFRCHSVELPVSLCFFAAISSI